LKGLALTAYPFRYSFVVNHSERNELMMNGARLAENHNERNELMMNSTRLAENHSERNELMMNSTRLS
jgi:hypothetical protein